MSTCRFLRNSGILEVCWRGRCDAELGRAGASAKPLGQREEGAKTTAQALHDFYSCGNMGRCLGGGGSFDTVNEFDAFKSKGAPLFKIIPRCLYEVMFLKNTWHLASEQSQRKCRELEDRLLRRAVGGTQCWGEDPTARGGSEVPLPRLPPPP